MKKLLMIAAASLSLMTGGCTVDLAEVQQEAVKYCGFLPTVIQVAEWAKIQSPYYTTASQFAQVICDAMTAPRAIRRGVAASEITKKVRLPDGTVVTVQGHFVR